MKVLTIKQPWAALIAQGMKPIENRTWLTKHRGPLLIHVSARMPFNRKSWLQFCRERVPLTLPDYDELAAQCGRIICKVELVDCTPIASLPKNLQSHWTAEGPVCWILENPTTFDGTPKAKGNLNLWNYSPE